MSRSMHTASFRQQLLNAGYNEKSRGYWWYRGKGIRTAALRRLLGA